MRSLVVKIGEQLSPNKEQADLQGKGHDDRKRVDYGLTYLVGSHLADDLQRDDDQRRTGGKCRRDKSWAKQGRVPERSCRVSGKQESGNRVD